MGTGMGFNNAAYYKSYFTQDFGCSRVDFNCECPQIVDPTTAAPPDPVAAPICINGIAVPAAVPALAPTHGTSPVCLPPRASLTSGKQPVLGKVLGLGLLVFLSLSQSA